MTGVIADSDDDSDGGDYSNMENTNVEQALKEQLLGSESVYRETPSTDSLFFQSILKEQGDAARHQVRGATAMGTVGLTENNQQGVVTLDSSIPGFHAEQLARIDSSYYLPTQSANIAVLPSSVIEADPYEIPSSPEKVTRTRTSATESTSQGSRKRRKTSNDDIETIVVENCPAVLLDETQSIPDAQVMAVDPDHLTASQRQEYESVESPPSSIDAVTAELPEITRNCPIESSGLATNINTQGSQHLQQANATITTESTPGRGKSTRKKGRKRKAPSPKSKSTVTEATKSTITVLDDSEEEESYQLGEEDDAIQSPPSSIKSDAAEPPPRKGRTGRPKKATKAGKAEETEQTTKRQRGRPKRNAKEEVLEEQDEPVNTEEKVTPVTAEEEFKAGLLDSEEEAVKTEEPVKDEEQHHDVTASKQSEEKVVVDEKANNIKPVVKKPLAIKMESGSRPLYRVGLSKRSSITPLLKSIRK